MGVHRLEQSCWWVLPEDRRDDGDVPPTQRFGEATWPSAACGRTRKREAPGKNRTERWMPKPQSDHASLGADARHRALLGKRPEWPGIGIPFAAAAPLCRARPAVRCSSVEIARRWWRLSQRLRRPRKSSSISAALLIFPTLSGAKAGPCSRLGGRHHQ